MSGRADILATLPASPGRRVIAAGMQGVLGAFLLYLAAANPPGHPLAVLALAGFGALMLWQAWGLYQATAAEIWLTREGLEDSTGRRLCRWDEMEGIDRGVFAFKPSNGFLVRLRAPATRAWAPGLWWRFGRQVGVGGTTSGLKARAMADYITILLVNAEERAKVGVSLPGD